MSSYSSLVTGACQMVPLHSWPEPYTMVVTIWPLPPALYLLSTEMNYCLFWIPIYLPLMAWSSVLCNENLCTSFFSLLNSNLETSGLVFFILSYASCLDQCFIQRWHGNNMCWMNVWIKGNRILNKRSKLWSQRWI